MPGDRDTHGDPGAAMSVFPRRYLKSRLPGPAVRWFEIEQKQLELFGVLHDTTTEAQDQESTVRVSYDDDTARVIVG